MFFFVVVCCIGVGIGLVGLGVGSVRESIFFGVLEVGCVGVEVYEFFMVL